MLVGEISGCRQCWFCPFHRREFSDMGSSSVVGGTSITTGGTTSCCHMARWRWDHHCFLSSTFVFFIASFVVYGFIAGVYAWLFVNPHAPLELASLGCRPDSEGSWAIGVFYGDSPFSLRPIEAVCLDFASSFFFPFFLFKVSLIWFWLIS